LIILDPYERYYSAGAILASDPQMLNRFSIINTEPKLSPDSAVSTEVKKDKIEKK